MKKFFLFTLLVLIFSACSGEKEYKYVETVKDKHSTHDSETETIKARTDSDAYVIALEKFYRAKIVVNEVNLTMGEIYGREREDSEPISFKIYSAEGKDITDIEFFTKEAKTKEVQDHYSARMLEIDNEHKEKERFKSNANSSRVDSVKIKELMPYFIVNKDEFDPNGQTWIEPKSAPKYVNRNAFYLYFGTSNKNSVPSILRIKMQYLDDDWLFIKKVQFSIDGNPFEIIPSDVRRDHGDGQIWEWFDEPLRNVKFRNALENAKSVKIKFIGSDYHKIRTVSEKQLKDIKNSISLYKAMGGL